MCHAVPVKRIPTDIKIICTGGRLMEQKRQSTARKEQKTLECTDFASLRGVSAACHLSD